MFKDYKKDLVKLFKKLHDEGAFSGLFDKLSQEDHYIKINYSTIWEFETLTNPAEHPLCYLYNNNIYFNRSQLLKDRGSLLPNKTIPPEIFDRDLINITAIVSSVVILFDKYFFDVTVKADKKYETKIKKLNKEFVFDPCIYFYSYDILLFVSEGLDGLYQGLYENEGKYKDKLPSVMTKMKYGRDEKKLFYDIRNENWFELLEELTKKHINGFYSLVENTNFEKIERSAVDYSPYLSPLWKATEVEFDYHFKYYSEDIVKSAKILLKKAKEHWNSKLRKKHRILLVKCKQMIERRGNYRSEGLYTIYLVLYHLALGKELELENQFESYLNQKQFTELNKQSEIISDISRESRNRNSLIHQNVLNSKNLFQRQQNLMISILNILSLLKEYKNLD